MCRKVHIKYILTYSLFIIINLIEMFVSQVNIRLYFKFRLLQVFFFFFEGLFILILFNRIIKDNDNENLKQFCKNFVNNTSKFNKL